MHPLGVNKISEDWILSEYCLNFVTLKSRLTTKSPTLDWPLRTSSPCDPPELCVSGKWQSEVMLLMTFLQERSALLNYWAAGFSWMCWWDVCWKWAGDEIQYQVCAVRSCFLSLSPSLHPSPLTWGTPLFATRSLHRWLKTRDRKIISAWAVLTLRLQLWARLSSEHLLQRPNNWEDIEGTQHLLFVLLTFHF